MAYSVLGQSAPSATTPTDLYTVPATTAAVVSTLTVCNRDSSAGTYRVSVRPAGAVQANQHYIAYEISLPATSTDAWTIGLTLEASDVVTVYASTAHFSFSLFGTEEAV